MEFNFFASRVNPTDQLSSVQAAMLHSGNHIILDDSDGEDDFRAYFSCPYCYVDIEVPVLCSHLQEEHCFDFRNAVCPLCADSLGKDVIGHLMAHHATSIKRRRRPAFTSKKLTTNNRGNKNGSVPDPLLPFICSIPFSDHESVERDDQSENENENQNAASAATTIVESNRSHLVEGNQNSEELNQRAFFVQQLITSTIF